VCGSVCLCYWDLKLRLDLACSKAVIIVVIVVVVVVVVAMCEVGLLKCKVYMCCCVLSLLLGECSEDFEHFPPKIDS
jgi:hypothetical protein